MAFTMIPVTTGAVDPVTGLTTGGIVHGEDVRSFDVTQDGAGAGVPSTLSLGTSWMPDWSTITPWGVAAATTMWADAIRVVSFTQPVFTNGVVTTPAQVTLNCTAAGGCTFRLTVGRNPNS